MAFWQGVGKTVGDTQAVVECEAVAENAWSKIGSPASRPLMALLRVALRSLMA